MLPDGEKAVSDVINILTKHLQQVHRAEHRELEEDLRDLQQLVTVAPAFLMLDRFVEMEDSRTSEAFKQAMVGIEKAMEQLSQLLFGVEEAEEGVTVTAVTAVTAGR
jgi:hypothetical protein